MNAPITATVLFASLVRSREQPATTNEPEDRQATVATQPSRSNKPPTGPHPDSDSGSGSG
jgi:hypothetical protein